MDRRGWGGRPRTRNPRRCPDHSPGDAAGPGLTFHCPGGCTLSHGSWPVELAPVSKGGARDRRSGVTGGPVGHRRGCRGSLLRTAGVARRRGRCGRRGARQRSGRRGGERGGGQGGGGAADGGDVRSQGPSERATGVAVDADTGATDRRQRDDVSVADLWPRWNVAAAERVSGVSASMTTDTVLRGSKAPPAVMCQTRASRQGTERR
jgi:hypothetical protein